MLILLKWALCFKEGRRQNMEEIKKGYKMTDVGVIPEDWEVKKLKEECQLVNGRAYKREELLNSGKYKVLRVGNFFSNESWYYSNLELPPKMYCHKGDLLYAWSCTYGARIWDEDNTIFHYHIWKITFDSAVEKKYLYYILNNDVEQQMKSSQGGTMSHITKSFLEERLFSFPSLKEQTTIATVLSDIDSFISALSKKIEKKKAIKQGLMQQLLTGKKRLPGFSGEWKERKLEECAKLFYGYLFTPDLYSSVGLYKVITIANVQEGKFSPYECNYVNMSNIHINDYQYLHRGDLLISMTGNLGRVCLVDIEGCVMNYRVGKLLPVKIDKYYLYHTINNKKFIETMTLKGKGAAQLNISKDDILSYKILVPPTRLEQTAIANILSDCDKEISSLESKLDKYKELKQGMMQQLLTGKIRLIS